MSYYIHAYIHAHTPWMENFVTVKTEHIEVTEMQKIEKWCNRKSY